MSDEQRLDWLSKYEKQNPTKYLQKFGVVTGKYPALHPLAGQPMSWEYVSPEEALKKLVPSFPIPKPAGIEVEVSEKAKVIETLKFAPSIVEEPVKEPKKRGRKKNV